MKDGQIKLHNVRLSFPTLFEAKSMDDGKPRFSASFLIDPKSPDGKANIKRIQDEMRKVAEAKWGVGKVPKSVVLALKDGDLKDYDGYSKMKYLSTGNSADRKPLVGKWDKQMGAVVTIGPDEIYAGCHVHAIVSFWAQDNKFGKKINANLQSVIFYKDGQPFGSGPVDVSGAFDEDDFAFEDADDGEDDEGGDFLA